MRVGVFDLCDVTGLKSYGVKGHGPLAKHEISLTSKAYADSDEKGEADDHQRRSRAGNDAKGAAENEKDEFWEEVHETIAYFTLFLISIHIAGVLVSSIVHREK